jgi:proline dehydrogenase
MSALDSLIASTLPLVPKPIVRHFSRPYIAGETMDEMLGVVRRLNEEGFLATVDILGEFSEERTQAERAVERYHEVMETLHDRGLECKVSVKLTQLGLKIDKEFCYQKLSRLVSLACEQRSFVRIDMEDSSCTSDTLEIYLRALEEHGPRVGCVIQSYLRRSAADVRRLVESRANVRLCKGIYVEPRQVAFQEHEVINRNYVRLLEELLGSGCYVGIATHDESLVWHAFRIIDRLGLDPQAYEFQMLLGVDEPLRRLVRDAGHRLRVYVPFGRYWYQYSLRRLRENPKIAGYVFRSLF